MKTLPRDEIDTLVTQMMDGKVVMNEEIWKLKRENLNLNSKIEESEKFLEDTLKESKRKVITFAVDIPRDLEKAL